MTRSSLNLVVYLVIFAGITNCVLGLESLPEGFAQKVQEGWLPIGYPVKNNPDVPKPITRNWANPRAGQPIRALFLCSPFYIHEVISIADSFDLEYDIVLFRAGSFAKPDRDPESWNLFRYYLKNQIPDVIVMASAGLGSLPVDCQEEIIRLNKEQGVGFVYAMPGIFPRVPTMAPLPSLIMDPLMPLVLDKSGYKEETGSVLPTGVHLTTSGVDYSKISWGSNVDSTVIDGAKVLLSSENNQRDLAAAVEYGKGRMVSYNRCYGELTYNYPFLPAPIMTFKYDERQSGKVCRWLKGMEAADQFYNWLGRTIIWAAHKEPKITIQKASIDSDQVALQLNNSSSTDYVGTVRLVVRSPFNTKQEVLEQSGVGKAGLTSSQKIVIPDLGYSGEHMVDVFLLNRDKKVVDWWSLNYKVPAKVKVEYVEDFKLYKNSDGIKLPLKITGIADVKKCTVHSELFDLDGRLLFDEEKFVDIVSTVTTETEVVIPLERTGISDVLANVRITVTVADRAIEIRDQLFVEQQADWQSLHIMPYGGYGRFRHPRNEVMSAVFKNAGFNVSVVGYPTDDRVRLTAELGDPIEINNMGPGGKVELDKIRYCRNFSPLIYEMQDEPELQFAPAIEARHGMKDFIPWLKQKYNNVETLNSVWQTDYEDWEQVKRLLWFEVYGTNNWAPWFDSRRQLDMYFLDRWKRGAEVVRQGHPGQSAGINFRSISTFSGGNLREFAANLGISSMYCDFVRAQNAVGYLHFGWRWVDIAQCCIGYTWTSNPFEERLRREAWDAVRHGVKVLAWFAPFCSEWLQDRDTWDFLSGDLTLNGKGRAIANINKQLLDGPGTIAAVTEPIDDGVLVYVPRRSFYAYEISYMEQQLLSTPSMERDKMKGVGPWTDQLPCAFWQPLRSAGYQFSFIGERDFTSERLEKARAVLLPRTICLGKDELKILNDFVKKGGCVIADSGTARRDEMGSVYSETPQSFRDTFGLERTTPSFSASPQEEKLNLCGAEQVEWLSAKIGTAYQKGKVYFLNFKIPVNYEVSDAIVRMLTESGVEPTYALKENYQDPLNLVASIIVRQRGDLTYLFVVGDGNIRDSNLIIELPESSYVYEVVTDHSLKYPVTQINDTIKYGQVRLYVLSKSAVSSFIALASKSRFNPGEKVSIDFEIISNEGKVGDSVIHLDYKTKGEGMLPEVPQTLLLQGGKGRLSFVLPLNSLVGDATIFAKDLASGKKCEISFTVIADK